MRVSQGRTAVENLLKKELDEATSRVIHDIGAEKARNEKMNTTLT